VGKPRNHLVARKRVQGAPWQGWPCTRSLAVVLLVGLWSTTGDCGEVAPGVQGTESPARGIRGESPGTPRGRVGGTKHNPSWAPKEKGPGRALVHPAGWVGRAHPILGAVGAATGQGPYNDVRLITGGVQRGLAPLVGVWGYPPHTEGGWVGKPRNHLVARKRVQGAPCQGVPWCPGLPDAQPGSHRCTWSTPWGRGASMSRERKGLPTTPTRPSSSITWAS